MEVILIVEDEPKIAELLKKYLQHSGYQTYWISQGDEVMPYLETQPIALVLLDLMLPGSDGLEICKKIRQTHPIPIIMLTARSEEIDRLLGLELGADDYICKPFSPREVVARVKAVLRRTRENDSPLPSAAELPKNSWLDLHRGRLTVNYQEQEIGLTLVEFELLAALLSQPGRIFSRQQLMGKVYTDNRIVSDRTIDSHIKKLRKKIRQLHPTQELIHSVYSVGYKFEALP